MTEALREALAELQDASKYVRVPGRAIFDEHDEVYYEDKQGKPCRRSDDGAQKKVRRFDKKRLLEIARHCNRRDQTGTLSPLCFGHTLGETKDAEGKVVKPKEEDQPEPVGYAHRYGVAYSQSLGRHVIRTDFYVKRDKYQKAKTFPRVSIELWDRHGVIDPIALIRSSPARDVGNWCYGRTGSVLRYSRELSMDPLEDDLPPENPEGGEGGEGGPSPEEHSQFMKHCFSHPLAQKFSKHYAMPEEPTEPDPTMAPEGEGEMPMQNGMAMPSATNGVLPQKPGEMPMQNRKGKGTGAAEDAQAIRYSRQEARIAQLESALAQQSEAKNVAEGRRIVSQLVAEGYELDPEGEVLKFSKLDEAGRNGRIDEIRRFHQRAPIGGMGVPITAGATPRASGYDPSEPETMPLDDQQKVLRYQRENRLWDVDWDELAAKALPAKYGRKQ